MSMTDPIADLLTRIRNALMAGHETVEVPHSRMRESIVRILRDEGFVTSFDVEEKQPSSILKIVLKYEKDRSPAIRGIQRVSTPGRRVYTDTGGIPTVLGGLGVNILSTSSGVMTGKSARAKGVGGEILCEVW